MITEYAVDKKIIAINTTGSSSIKFSLYKIGETERLVFKGSLTQIGHPICMFSVWDAQGNSIVSERITTRYHDTACDYVFSWIFSQGEDCKPEHLRHKSLHNIYSFSVMVFPVLFLASVTAINRTTMRLTKTKTIVIHEKPFISSYSSTGR